MTTASNKLSPMMQQWHACKTKAGDALLLFQLGDFFEAFYDDAMTVAAALDITLTKRQEIPMSGIPVQHLDTHITTLLSKGFSVAIAEQLAPDGKGLVQREITRILSPGAHHLVSESSNNFFAAISEINGTIGVAFLDVSTGDCIVLEVTSEAALLDALQKRMPKELLISERCTYKTLPPTRITKKEHWYFDYKITHDVLIKQFGLHALDGFGLHGALSAINAAGALLYHVHVTLCQPLAVTHLRVEHPSSTLHIPHTTISHLDLLDLYKKLNATKTAMGSRLLKEWLLHPLLDPKEIQYRQDKIAALIQSPLLPLDGIRDLERLAVRLQTKIASPRDLKSLADSLSKVPNLQSSIFKDLPFFDVTDLVQTIQEALLESPPTKYTEGNIFKPSYNATLSEILTLKANSETWLAQYQSHLQETLGIKTLKVGFSRAFGYFIEVSRGQAHRMPPTFEKRQTLVGNERFISPELKEYEHKILHAEDRQLALEKELFLALHEQVAARAHEIRTIAKSIATIDALHALAIVAIDEQYVRPEIHSGNTIELIESRHPLLDQRHCIPNDLYLSPTETLQLITGPNMAGKSTFIRQVALLVIMAQMGSFIPAKRASLCLIDKIFSRVGASDDLTRGQSTFMVEMAETAYILNQATPNSLVILDEIGRGTSTYDGIAIASAVAEYLLRIGCKTLFATHFWELTQLEQEHPHVKNYRVAVQENEDGILFLHKILPGGADKSYGIHVARLAGLPAEVIRRAQKRLAELEDKNHPDEEQLLLFS